MFWLHYVSWACEENAEFPSFGFVKGDLTKLDN